MFDAPQFRLQFKLTFHNLFGVLQWNSVHFLVKVAYENDCISFHVILLFESTSIPILALGGNDKTYSVLSKKKKIKNV